jgi:hypothetical protein
LDKRLAPAGKTFSPGGGAKYLREKKEVFVGKKCFSPVGKEIFRGGKELFPRIKCFPRYGKVSRREKVFCTANIFFRTGEKMFCTGEKPVLRRLGSVILCREIK